MSTDRPARPRPPRKPPGRKIRLTLAMLIAAGAVLIGLVAGYVSRGDPAPAGLVTESRSVPVVTLTVTGPAPAPVTVTVTETAPDETSTTGAAPATTPEARP